MKIPRLFQCEPARSSGTGTDVVKRVVPLTVDGMISATILTLGVIPAIYPLWRGREFGAGTRLTMRDFSSLSKGAVIELGLASHHRNKPGCCE